jgi:hypothetical protein
MLIEEPQWKRELDRPRQRREDNIKIDLAGMYSETFN